MGMVTATAQACTNCGKVESILIHGTHKRKGKVAKSVRLCTRCVLAAVASSTVRFKTVKRDRLTHTV